MERFEDAKSYTRSMQSEARNNAKLLFNLNAYFNSFKLAQERKKPYKHFIYSFLTTRSIYWLVWFKPNRKLNNKFNKELIESTTMLHDSKLYF
jgi:hypothetical protein